ncbi:MAG TPA: hypothetical protein PLR90_03415 [Methylophilus sp.]|nr:hypothetical protein [Methylophilus sp.]HQQ32944.1 hypothetical protein [Methylophilus sp.]
MSVSRYHLVKTLYAKEWVRLKRNPAALMAVGLLILMAFLLNIESKAQQTAKRSSGWPCLVAFNEDNALIQHLKRNQHPKLKVKFVHEPKVNDSSVRYAPVVDCVAEIQDVQEFQMLGMRPQHKIIFRHGGSEASIKKTNGLARWLLSSMAAKYSNHNIEQRIHPLPNSKSKPSASLDLGNKKSRAMVSAMLIFSTQFFVCCALFISLTAHEKEKSILQALALTLASPRMQLIVKVFFHLSLALIASTIMLAVISPAHLFFVGTWWILIASSIGLISVATILTSLNRTQTSASLMGFCYLMFVGVVFALSQNFKGFSLLKMFMFEHHVISALSMFFNGITRNNYLLLGAHLLTLTVIVIVLSTVSFLLWQRKGWKT